MLWLNPAFSKKVNVSPFEMLNATLEEVLKINEMLDIYNDFEDAEEKDFEDKQKQHR